MTEKNVQATEFILEVVCDNCGHKGELIVFIGVSPKKDWDEFLKKNKEPK